jgi:predicted GIY-YIG superfamily endonuclease
MYTFYKLTCTDPNLVYIGSTKQQLSKRIAQHVQEWRHNGYGSSKLLFDAGNVRTEILCQIDSADKDEAEDRERYIILNTDNTVNIRAPPGRFGFFKTTYCERCKENVKFTDVMEHKKWHHHLSMV